MLHEFLSAVTDDLLSVTEAETAEEINCEDIVTVVADKFKSWGLNPNRGYKVELVRMVSLILYRIITKDMRIPEVCAEVSKLLDKVSSYMQVIPDVFLTLYSHAGRLPLDSQDIRLLKKYFYPKESVERASRSKFYLPSYYHSSFFYVGNLGIDYESNLNKDSIKQLAEDIIVNSDVDAKGVLGLNLNQALFYTSIWYRTVIINVQMKELAKAIWRKALGVFGTRAGTRVGSTITAVKIKPYYVTAEGATKQTIQDNFSIKMDGHSYTVSEFIDALTSELTKMLNSSKSALVANKRNLTQDKNNSSLGEDLQGNASNTSTGVKSNGIYSVMTGKWIKEPVQTDIPDLDKDAFDKVFNEWEDKYFELLKKIGKTEEETHIASVDDSTEETSEKEILTESNEDKSELISNFIEDLYDLRKDSIATEGEYGIGNLVFKEFRNLGYLDNLKDLKNEERSKELSLENLKEDIDDDMNTSNDYDYGPADSLPEMTPYMLRQDGALLKCGDIHPYIKMSTKTSYETNLHTLNLHPEFLDWFYENTLDPVTKDLIDKFRKEPTPELMDVLNDLTNEDFCRVRTSNYKVKSGGKNGQIYFRISSTNFDWFNLIWGVVAKFVHDIDNVTVMKDSQTFGGKEFDYYYDHVPVDEFLTLKGNPEIK